MVLLFPVIMVIFFISCCLDNFCSLLTDFLLSKFPTLILLLKCLSWNTNLIFISWSSICNGSLVHSKLSSSTYLGNTNIQKNNFCSSISNDQVLSSYLFPTWPASNAVSLSLNEFLYESHSHLNFSFNSYHNYSLKMFKKIHANPCKVWNYNRGKTILAFAHVINRYSLISEEDIISVLKMTFSKTKEMITDGSSSYSFKSFKIFNVFILIFGNLDKEKWLHITILIQYSNVQVISREVCQPVSISFSSYGLKCGVCTCMCV